ncbi:DEAD/DEAH box helicase [uncultured Photobacterium sp.]|uniref:DEAD/DEAH box helicase n=1 Tax=uncultured Photobacterium sp. TaxID=173973 RepID=UPI002621379A|nr:DEAD/DEAH box helicase [uncultured Photobacterium sp.]
MTIFTPGMRIDCRDAEWLVTRVEPANSQNDQIVYCIGADDLTRGHQAAFLSQIETIREVDPRKTKLVRDNSNGYMKSKLFLEAQLRKMPLTDPHPHVDGMGAFSPMNYQKQAVQRALSQLRPRLLLADAVGLGKTIEVGMILGELMKRGQADRILVLAKKSMLSQFQAELWNRFSIPLIRMDSDTLSKLQLKIPASKNPFEVYQRVIISIDTLKDVGRYSHFLEDTRWDVVVIDEAHNVAGGTNPEKHLSYRLARRLARRSNSMVLTTATPHNGKRETFGRLISLLDPSAVPDPQLKEYEAEDIAPFFLMRFKEDVRAEAGDNFADPIVVELEKTTCPATEKEEAVYQQLAHIRQQVLDKKIISNAIVQWGMYKSFLSSPEACRSTAEKRLKELESKTPSAAEIPALQELVKRLKPLSIEKSARFNLLLKQLEEMHWNSGSQSPRLLLFTESRVTQIHLAAALAKHFSIKYNDKQESQANQAIATIHGGMSDIALASTIESFGTGTSPVRIMIATEVASEGVNLHHQCHNIIHYDLPWSIITLIQRNGRIDRFGQKHNPMIRYLMVDTREGLMAGDKEIFERLVGKVEEINRSTRTGESLLRLYDAQKEEKHIATHGILAGNTQVLDQENKKNLESNELEDMLLAATGLNLDNLLASFSDKIPQEAASENAKTDHKDNSRIRLMDEATFFERGYQTLNEHLQTHNWQPLEKTQQQYILTPPKELARRLGMPGADSEVVFGATSIPDESWPDEKQLYLTTDPRRVDTAIKAAMAQKGQWSKELLLTEHHPVMDWLAERLMMLQPRGEAPVISSPHLDEGELLFCFIGQVSSRAGTPLIVDPHAVSFRKGGRYQFKPLREALENVKFEQLVNTGKTGNLFEGVVEPEQSNQQYEFDGNETSQTPLPSSTNAANAAKRKLVEGFISAAVTQSLRHMESLCDERQQLILPRLEEEEKRLSLWFDRWATHIEGQLANLPPEGKRATRLRQKREEMEKYLKDRTENWKETYYRASDKPTTRLVLVVEGVR